MRVSEGEGVPAGVEIYRSIPAPRGERVDICSDVDEYQPSTKIRKLILFTPSLSLFQRSEILVSEEYKTALAKEAAGMEAAAKEAVVREEAAKSAMDKAESAKAAAARYEAFIQRTAVQRAHSFAAAVKDHPHPFIPYVIEEGLCGSNRNKWKKYFELMHNSQGFDIKWSPDDGYKSTIVHYEIAENRRAEICVMCNECIQFFNQNNEQKFKYCDGQIENVAFTREPDYSLYYITFEASQVDDSISSKRVIFQGKYVTYHETSEETGEETEGREAVFCMMKDVAVAQWNQRKDEPCTLSCCKRYQMPSHISSSYMEYIRDSWKKDGPHFSRD